jgi:hypothetical protein
VATPSRRAFTPSVAQRFPTQRRIVAHWSLPRSGSVWPQLPGAALTLVRWLSVTRSAVHHDLLIAKLITSQD